MDIAAENLRRAGTATMRKVLYTFGLLTDTDVDWIARTGVRRQVQPGETLIEEGGAVESIIFLLQGEFRVSTQMAVGECLALFLDRQILVKKLETDFAFASRFYRALAVFPADRLRDTVGHLGYGKVQDAGLHTPEKDELDGEILDRLSMAGDRFDRMFKMLSGHKLSCF
jgi:CRP/FNR family transcriptional regulator, cyclic AMP receptor protein